MILKANDYIGLLKELQIIRGKDFSESQIESLITSFKTINWDKACWIVKSISRLHNIPNNLYGLILDRIDETKYRSDQELEQRTDWTANEKCLTPQQWEQGMRIMRIIGKCCMLPHPQEHLNKLAASMNDAIDKNDLDNFLIEANNKFDVAHPELADRYYGDGVIRSMETV